MTTIKEMTKDQRDEDVDRRINQALLLGLEHKQDAPQMAFIDTVLRPAMKWLNDMEAGDTDVSLVENAMASGIASMMGELALRVNRRDDLAGGQVFAQALIERVARYLGDNLQLNFHAPVQRSN